MPGTRPSLRRPARDGDGRDPHPRPVDVAMVIQAFAPVVGGGELQLERLLGPLAARGVRARVLTRAVAGSPRREFRGGAEVVRSPIAGESPLAAIVYVARALGNIVSHRRTTAIVHAHGALSPATIAMAASLCGIPAVVTPLGAGEPGDLRRLQHKPGGRRRIRALVRRAHFVALSRELVTELTALGVPPSRIHAIANGFDASTFHPVDASTREALRGRLGLSADPVTFVFAGRLHPVKRIDTVIDALAAVPAAALVIVGDGPERVALQRRAAERNVADRVRFAGERERVHEYLQAADAFVLPSIAEGMSNALLEAMACGLACVVTSAISGTSELLGDDRGVIAPPLDPAAWATAMQDLVDRPAERHALGAAAARHVHGRFTLERTADQLATLYRELAGSTAR